MARLEPPNGKCYVGANINFSKETPQAFNKKTGINHAVFVEFFHFPLTSNNKVKNFIIKCKNAGAIALVTLEPFNGLNTVTPKACRELVQICSDLDARIIIRFEHEMNGSWYAWGQQPKKYIQKFRILAK
ncbi:MAG: glycosyl hydrolase [Verrucomicrobiota bacterium]|nr:glycosyl hydrolase [Verrucomicrobiota bacterium]